MEGFVSYPEHILNMRDSEFWIHAVVKCSSVVEAAAADGSKQLLSSSGNTNASRKYLGKGKIVHGVSCSGEDYKSSLSAGGCLEIHNLKLLAGSSALSLKLILVGTEKNEHFLFVATKHSLVSQLSPSGRVPMDCGGKEPYFRAREMDPTPSGVTRATIHKELVSDSKEGARIGSYVGIVTDIPMPGQLVELNKQAWLLLTHYNVSQLHRLHVGAMGIASYCEPKVQVSRSVHSGAADWIKEGRAELDGIIDQSIDLDLGLYGPD
ncbi:unnamed protein product [Sphagnum jensenii]